MTSTIAPLTNLTYKGTDLQDFPRVFLQITEGGPGASPEVRGDNRHVPYRRGQIYAPKRADRLAIGLIGFIAGEGATEANQRSDTADARQSLASVFDVESGVGTLSVDDMDGTTWTCSAYPEVYLPEFDPAIPSFVNVSVRLVAIDPPNWVASGS